MGSDFSALLRYDGPVAIIEAIARLERDETFPTLKALTRRAQAQGCSVLAEAPYAAPAWRSRPDWDAERVLLLRPSLPSVPSIFD